MPKDTSARIGAFAGVLAVVEPALVATGAGLGFRLSPPALAMLLVIEIVLLVVAVIWFLWPHLRPGKQVSGQSPPPPPAQSERPRGSAVIRSGPGAPSQGLKITRSHIHGYDYLIDSEAPISDVEIEDTDISRDELDGPDKAGESK